MSIPLPPLPKLSANKHYYTADQLRARDQEIVAAVLDAAAKVCDRYTEGQWLAEQIRALDFHHE